VRDSCFKRSVGDLTTCARVLTIRLPYGRLNRPAGFEMYEEACVEGTQSADKVGFSVKQAGSRLR
jgi:hypothetical protein